MAKETKSSLIRNTGILVAATIVSRIIGLVYRSPMGMIIGNEGLGYYGTASNLYAILLLISCYSIPMAVSKIVSERLALGQYRNAHRVFHGALLYAAVVGGAAALVCYFGGRYLLAYNAQNALPALRVLAPTIFLSGILGVLRGYFQAHNTMLPTSVSQVSEQIVNAIVSILASWLLIRTFATDSTTHAIYGAAGGTTGTAAGVLTGLAVMLIIYMRNRKGFMADIASDTNSQEESLKEIFKVLFLMITPVIFTTFIYNCNSYVNNYMYFSILGRKGMDSVLLNESYGEFSNYYLTLINVPLAMASASSSAMMPELSACYAVRDYKGANERILTTIKMTMFLIIPSAIGLGVLSYPITQTLFPSCTELSGMLLRVGAVSVVFSALSSITNSALQSIGQQKIALRNAAISLGVNVVSLFVILSVFPKSGIYGVLLSSILFSVSMCVLNNISMRHYLQFRNEWKNTYVKPLISAGVMGVGTWAVYTGLRALTKRPSIAMFAAILIAVLIYLLLSVKVSGITEQEMRRMPMGTKLVRVMKLLRIY